MCLTVVFHWKHLHDFFGVFETVDSVSVWNVWCVPLKILFLGIPLNSYCCLTTRSLWYSKKGWPLWGLGAFSCRRICEASLGQTAIQGCFMVKLTYINLNWKNGYCRLIGGNTSQSSNFTGKNLRKKNIQKWFRLPHHQAQQKKHGGRYCDTSGHHLAKLYP